MSGVYARNRHPTGCDYLDAAYNMRLHTLHVCARFPKRYKEWVTDYIVGFSAKCHIKAEDANSIIPKYREEADERMKSLVAALNAAKHMYSQFDFAYGLFQFDMSDERKSNERILNEILPDIEKTEKMLGAIIASDKKRYKNLPWKPKSAEDETNK